jgi:hypothetical protein
MTLPPIVNKIMEILRVKTPIGGLEISDSTVRLAVPSADRWDIYSQRLPTGVVEDGVAKDGVRFKEAITALRKLASARYGHIKIPIMVSLVSSQIYTQTFPLPIIREDEAEKVIDLNLKMISPLNYDEVYVGWQFVKKDAEAGKFEVRGAFLRRTIVEPMEIALEEAGFRPLALEPRSLSLTRLIRNLGVGVTKEVPLVVLLVDDGGINFLVIKEGQLYFEYTELWRNLFEPGKSITLDEFKSAIKRSVQQLVNFYSQRWPEPLRDFLIIASSLVAEVEKILKEDFSFSARELVFAQGKNIKGEWFAAIGAAWRGLTFNTKEDELSLLGTTSRQIYSRERYIDFLSLWRVITPTAIGLVLILMLASDLLIIRETRRLDGSSPKLPAESRASFMALESQAGKFNASVALMKTVRKTENFKNPLIQDILKRASSSFIGITSLKMQSDGLFTLSGSAPAEDRIILFKNALKDGKYQNINLPLSNIRKDNQGYVFSMTFSLISRNTP